MYVISKLENEKKGLEDKTKTKDIQSPFLPLNHSSYYHYPIRSYENDSKPELDLCALLKTLDRVYEADSLFLLRNDQVQTP